MSVTEAGPFLLNGLAFIVAGAILLFTVFLLIVAAIWAGHIVVERVFGECDDCRGSRIRREQDERERVAEAERVIRQHGHDSRSSRYPS